MVRGSETANTCFDTWEGASGVACILAYHQSPQPLCGKQGTQCDVKIEAPGKGPGGGVGAPDVQDHKQHAGQDLHKPHDGLDLWQARNPANGPCEPLPGRPLHHALHLSILAACFGL